MNAVLTVLLLLSLWVIYEVLIKKQILDNSRDNLFAIRHELFMLATKNNKLKFDSKLYREMELIINSNIRYLHKVNHVTLFINYILTKDVNKNKKQSFNKFIKNAEANERYDKEIIEEIKIIKGKLDFEILKFLIKNSLTLTIVFLGITIYAVFNYFIDIIKCKIKNISWNIDYKDKVLTAVMKDKVSYKLINAVESIAQNDNICTS